MLEKLQIACDSAGKEDAEKVQKILVENGFEATMVQKEVNPAELVLVILNAHSSEESLYRSLPWLKEQFAYSSYKGFRLFPILVYSPAKENPEKLFEGELGKMYENVFSAEFKPFGWKRENDVLDEEFLRVLSESYAE